MQGKHFRTFFKTWRVRLGLYKRCCFDLTTYNLFTKNYPSKLIPCTYSFHFSLILAPLCILSKKAQSISVLSFMSKFLAIRASSGHWIAHPTIIFYDKMFLAFHRSVWGNPLFTLTMENPQSSLDGLWHSVSVKRIVGCILRFGRYALNALKSPTQDFRLMERFLRFLP